MTYTPPLAEPPIVHNYNTWAFEPGFWNPVMNRGTRASAVWPTASTALFVPMYINTSCTVLKLAVLNGTAVAGNIDLGIYSENGALIVSKGSTPQAGTSAPQVLDITDTTLGPGRYYIGLALSDATTATVNRVTFTDAGVQRAFGLRQMATAFPLPSSATFATATSNNYVPFVSAVLQLNNT